jgi:hypothetical protein
MWEFVADPVNRDALGWLAGGIVAIAGGFWAVFTYFHNRKSSDTVPRPVAADRSVAAGRDVKVGGDITITAADSGNRAHKRQ